MDPRRFRRSLERSATTRHPCGRRSQTRIGTDRDRSERTFNSRRPQTITMSTEASQSGIAVTKDLWTEVDQYFSEILLPADPSLDSVIEPGGKSGLPAFSVSPNPGRLLEVLGQL